MSRENMAKDLIQSCVCSNLRKTTRVVTHLYDKFLSSTGLKITQYSMMVNIANHKDISISELGEAMLLDQTTVTRNVNILKKSGFVKITKSTNDSRTRIITVTELGFAKLKEAYPIWLKIQEKIVADIGEERYKNLLETLEEIQQLSTSLA